MKNIFKSFFYNSDNKFMPPYFWVTILMTLVIIMTILKVFGPVIFRKSITDALLLGVLGFTVGWCGVYNYGKKRKDE